MKKYLFMALFVVTILMMAACEGEKEVNITMEDMQKQMLSVGKKLPEMSIIHGSSENTESLFSSLSDIDYSHVEDYFYAYSSEGKADEVAVIKLKKSKYAEEAKESLRNHMQDRKIMFQNYKPDEAVRVEKGLVFSDGRYVVLVIADELSKIKAEFEKIMEE